MSWEKSCSASPVAQDTLSPDARQSADFLIRLFKTMGRGARAMHHLALLLLCWWKEARKRWSSGGNNGVSCRASPCSSLPRQNIPVTQTIGHSLGPAQGCQYIWPPALSCSISLFLSLFLALVTCFTPPSSPLVSQLTLTHALENKGA